MGNFSLSLQRIRILIAAITFVLILFAFRLIDIQAVHAQSYAARAHSEMTRTTTALAARGAITDIHGVEFARSVGAVNVVVNQTLIKNPTKAAQIVAPILSMPKAQIQERITGKRLWNLVARGVTPAQWHSVSVAIDRYNQNLDRKDASKKILGFAAERVYAREYPSGSLIGSLIGHVNQDGVGASGLESSMNSTIAGVNGKYSYADGRGAQIPGSQEELVHAENGTTIRLTIDRDIQWVASQAIAQAVKSSHALSGTVIVMDPKTGHILAHATVPTFDPNNMKNVSLLATRNPSVQEVFEPGSTGKVMTLAAAIEEGTITPITVFNIPYSLKVSNRTFKDHEKHPALRLTTSGILAVSSNTGAIQIGATLKNSVLYDYLRKFGVGQSSGSGLAGESSGLLSQVSQWSGTTAPTVAFGQGYSMTAMQTTSVFATIANDGVRIRPTVVAGVSDASGHFTPTSVAPGVRVLSPATAATMRLMMEGVVSVNGTAPTAAISGYRVAGKTGTAMRIDESCHCYRGYTASFIGFAPADQPKYVVSVTIQAPQGVHWGGALGGPVFRKVMSFALESGHISPTMTLAKPFPLTEAQAKKSKY